jgi:hypothetical protein
MRVWNWLRDVTWLPVIAVALALAGIVLAVISVVVPGLSVWIWVALTLVISGVVFGLVGLRSS